MGMGELRIRVLQIQPEGASSANWQSNDLGAPLSLARATKQGRKRQRAQLVELLKAKEGCRTHPAGTTGSLREWRMRKSGGPSATRDDLSPMALSLVSWSTR